MTAGRSANLGDSFASPAELGPPLRSQAADEAVTVERAVKPCDPAGAPASASGALTPSELAALKSDMAESYPRLEKLLAKEKMHTVKTSHPTYEQALAQFKRHNPAHPEGMPKSKPSEEQMRSRGMILEHLANRMLPATSPTTSAPPCPASSDGGRLVVD